jgi:phosphoribosylglycinamide formyltransferase 1
LNVIALSSYFSTESDAKKRPIQTIFFPHLYSFFNVPFSSFYMTEELSPVRVAIFASGQGTNAREIIRYFHEEGHLVLGRLVRISLIVCNKTGAGILDIAKSAGIPVLMIEKEKFFRGSQYLEELAANDISFIVLAGFLWKIPAELVRVYPNRILNIHPALLPAYGGKGMFGKAVHEAVIAAHERQSGITIHYVDEIYDNGKIFFQASVDLSPEETAETLAGKIHKLEYRHYPEQIGRWLEKRLTVDG